MANSDSRGERGVIIGLPTLLAIYEGRLDAGQILDGLRAGGYPPDDVRIYYRLKGTDQVLDAFTGHIAGGQSLSEEEIKKRHLNLNQVDTLVLMHPDPGRFPVIREVLARFGNPTIIYEGGEGEVEGPAGARQVERHDGSAPA
jgi:hypothetical protein